MVYRESDVWLSIETTIERIATAEFSGDRDAAWSDLLCALREGEIRARGCFKREHYTATKCWPHPILPETWGPPVYDRLSAFEQSGSIAPLLTDELEYINYFTVEIRLEDALKYYPVLAGPIALAHGKSLAPRASGRPGFARKAAEQALDKLYPEEISPKPWKTIESEVNTWLEQNGLSPVSVDTVRRAAMARTGAK